jgi:hypothetical protein
MYTVINIRLIKSPYRLEIQLLVGKKFIFNITLLRKSRFWQILDLYVTGANSFSSFFPILAGPRRRRQ